ncbi:MAG: TIR domain-containing protein [Cyanobacteria bacterium P01_F01_bin.53]
MTRIFISYRRRDSGSEAGRIYDVLCTHFGRDGVFKDVDDIKAGDDFRNSIQEAVGQCQILVAIIGKIWLEIKDDSGKQKLENPDDWVRLEIETALKRDILTIPILLDGVRMPKPRNLPIALRPLAYRNAARVRQDPDFRLDMERVIGVINRHQYKSIPKDFLIQISKDLKISEGELAVLQLALNGLKNKDIAQRLNISETATSGRLSKVYKKFQISGNRPGKLTYLKRHLEESSSQLHPDKTLVKVAQPQNQPKSLSKKQTEDPSDTISNTVPALSSATHYQWHDAPKLNLFQGRVRRLQELKDWILMPTREHKLLAICGIGGIGKTYLARKLAEDIGEQFDQVIWMGLEPDHDPLDFFTSLWTAMQFGLASYNPTANGQKNQPSSVLSLIKQISKELSKQRHLIIIDGFEKVFNTYPKDSKAKAKTVGIPTFDASRRQQASEYKAGFSAFGDWLNHLQTTIYKHPSKGSCVILTSREKPKEMLGIETKHPATKLYKLGGLTTSEVEKLLNSFRLQGSSADYGKLVSRYCGHPMALRLAANTVKDIFSGKIKDFVEQDISVFDDLRSVIKSQFRRLPPIEKEVMHWLAINHRPCTLEDLKSDIVSLDHKRNLIHTLRSLQRRFLVERKELGTVLFHLHPIIEEYILDRFVRAVFLDLMRGNLELFNSYALMKADAEDELRDFQRDNIIYPIVGRLTNHLKSLYKVDEYLTNKLHDFRQDHIYWLGYAGGNFINLLVQLSQDQTLSNKDFSQLTIWQAYLQGVQLRQVNFNKAKFARSVFTETLSDMLAIVLTLSQVAPHQMGYLACGDANGMVHLWHTQTDEQQWPVISKQKCAEWAAHSSWVRTMAFIPDRSMLVTGGDDNLLRLWQLPNPLAPSQAHLDQPLNLWQHQANDWIHTVAVSTNGMMIASGGDNEITLYCTQTGQVLRRFHEHNNNVIPSTKPKGTTHSKIEQTQKRHQDINLIRALAFSADGKWLASSGDDYTICLWEIAALSASEAQPPQKTLELTGHTDLINSLSFSPDSKQLISGGADKTIRVWDIESGQCKVTFEHPRGRVRSLAVSEDGQLLVSGGDDCQVMLWDLKTLSHIQDISTQQSRIWSVALQQQGNELMLLAGGDKQTLMIWKVTPLTSQSSKSNNAPNHLADISEQPNDETSNNNHPSRLTPLSLERLKTYRGYTHGIRTVAFLNENRIIGGGDLGELRVWNTEGDRKATLPLHKGRIWSITVDKQHARIASASDNHTIRLWDAHTGQCLTTLTGHCNWVRTVAFSHRGGLLASGDDDWLVSLVFRHV